MGCDPIRLTRAQGYQDFNPRTPCGVRLGNLRFIKPAFIHFNPRTPCGVRRISRRNNANTIRFQSTHPVWGATRFSDCRAHYFVISIHAPRVGCDTNIVIVGKANHRFQSTHPVWGATGDGYACHTQQKHFNPRTPCGVRPSSSILSMVGFKFQSTHPVWGATLYDELSQERRRKIRGGPPIFCGGNQKKPRYFTANRAESGTSPAVRAKRARVLRCHISAKRRIARPFPSSDFPDSKSADCPFPGPSDGSACP